MKMDTYETLRRLGFSEAAKTLDAKALTRAAPHWQKFLDIGEFLSVDGGYFRAPVQLKRRLVVV